MNKVIVFILFLTIVVGATSYVVEMYGQVPTSKHCATVLDDWSTTPSVGFDVSTARLSNIAKEVTIPVVFHVLYRKNIENITDYQIQSQIKVLNADFSGTNTDRTNIPTQFKSILSGDTKIRFKLAEVDPYGNSTTGIIRKKTKVKDFDIYTNDINYSARGGSDAWPSAYYLNIWVGEIGAGTLGYAQFPNGNPATDGVVLRYTIVGKKAMLNPDNYSLGRTATHEVGHWLGLKHIWGDGSMIQNGCDLDDGIADTPNAATSGSGCVFVNECGSLNMNNNFMDYGFDNCLNAFTKGQANKMQSLFYNGGARHSIINSLGLKNNVQQVPTSVANASEVIETNLSLIEYNGVYTASWGSIPNIDFYSLKLKTGSERWKYFDIPVTSTSARLDNLDPCVKYHAQVIGVAGTKKFKLRGKSKVKVISTQQCDKRIPSNLKFNEQNKTLSWTPTGANKYEVQYRVYGMSNTTSKYTKSSVYSFTGLKKNKIYQVRVRSVYTNKNKKTYSKFSKVVAFKI